MGLLSKLFKKQKDNNICTDKDNQYYGYPTDLKNFCEYQDKYTSLWNLYSNYIEKINYYYYNYINTNSHNDFNNLLIYNAWQSKYKLTNQLLYTWLREFTKAGIKDVCNNLGRYPLDKYLEENSKEIGKDYAYVRHDSFWEN